MEVIVLREAEPADQAWLEALYADVRGDEVAAFGWDAATASMFLAQQHRAQQLGYRASYPDSACDMIQLADDEALKVGRLWVDRSSSDIHVLDISLLAPWRGRGIGRYCLQRLIAEAGLSERTVSLSVHEDNRARRLYERLGFEAIAIGAPYTSMRWHPACGDGREYHHHQSEALQHEQA